MIMVVGYLAVLTILLGAFLGLLHRIIDNENRAEWRQVCFNLAEAGIESAISELKTAPGEYRGENQTPLGEGCFSVSVEPGDSADKFFVTATGEIVNGDMPLASARIVAEVSVPQSGRVKVLDWREVKRR